MELLGAIGSLLLVLGLAYALMAYVHFRGSWSGFQNAFTRAWVSAGEREKSKPCPLTINDVLLSDGRAKDQFSGARPHVLVRREGLVFLLRPNPLRLFKPVLVRFDQLKSFGRVRDHDAEWIEIEFEGRGMRGWAHIPIELAAPLRDRGIQEGVPAHRFRPLLDVGSDIDSSPAVLIYRRAHRCSKWTAEALETLENRDPVDAFIDVESLWACLYEFDQAGQWSKANEILLDSSTSYWLIAVVREAMSERRPSALRDATELLRIVRERLDLALGTHSGHYVPGPSAA